MSCFGVLSYGEGFTAVSASPDSTAVHSSGGICVDEDPEELSGRISKVFRALRPRLLLRRELLFFATSLTPCSLRKPSRQIIWQRPTFCETHFISDEKVSIHF
jgi:hypothetical protein